MGKALDAHKQCPAVISNYNQTDNIHFLEEITVSETIQLKKY